MAKSTIIGFPRLGQGRELKRALEHYWKGECDEDQLKQTAFDLRRDHISLQKTAGIDLIPSGDFSLYDHVLDMAVTFGIIPKRYGFEGRHIDLETYFAMARGAQKDGLDVAAAEMTKWFDTNYHYIVPELEKEQTFNLSSKKYVDEYLEAKKNGTETRPVLIGPVSFLLLSKTKADRHPLSYMKGLLSVYKELLAELSEAGAKWVQLDEPFLVTDLDVQTKAAYQSAYQELRSDSDLKFFITTPFGALDDNTGLVASLPIDALHIDMVRGAGQLANVLDALPQDMILAMGLVNGRNIWRNNLEKSLQYLEKASRKIGPDRIWVAPSCSLLHAPYDIDMEINMDPELRSWLAFSRQKLDELVYLTYGLNEDRETIVQALASSAQAIESRKISARIHNKAVQERVLEQPLAAAGRASDYPIRREKQKENLDLPMFPTTTIGSFPQTTEVRKQRAAFKRKDITSEEYDVYVKEEIASCVSLQEDIGLDVLVHGEFERNDMVEFFGEKLKGFAFTEHGWVQSYGSRGVKPPIIYGDVVRTHPMTLDIITYAQSVSNKPLKGMLTGPVTILQWSFVRDDQPRSATAHQIALALQDEVLGLEENGMKIIQIDEPAFREGLPLRRKEQKEYFSWAVQAFRLAATGVRDETQIHTHMCYSDFNNIIMAIKDMDADVISIETSRSQMELLDAFVNFKYPAAIGPGVYDIHSPRIPSEEEMIKLLEKACEHLKPEQIWVNPDCGLKTRDWPEVEASLKNMVAAAKEMRSNYKASS